MSENKFFFQDKSQYENFIGSWKTATNSEMKHRLTVEHFVLYKMFKGQDWTKCFCPATNLIKMRSQGKSSPYHAANEAMRNIEYAQTHKWIAENMLKPFGGRTFRVPCGGGKCVIFLIHIASYVKTSAKLLPLSRRLTLTLNSACV